MPVTAKIVNHPAKTWDQNKVSTSEKLLEESTPQHHRRCQRIVQSSFDGSDLQQTHVSASANGFVWAAFHAYSGHHQLVLRPEDIWFAILTQLSFFINAHAEELRSFFVAHDGREPLKAISEVEDYRYLAEQMAELIGKNVNDPELKDWVMPAFSTTTDEDRVVGAVLFMGAMQKYFSYYFAITCGIPSVTLLGEVCDWRVILKRLDKIDLLGDEPRQFAAMLRPIVRHLVLTFEEPTSDQVKHFWNTIVHKHELMSGEDFLSGWLTAFCFWSESGYAKEKSNMNIQLGDVAYPTIGITSVPAGLASVPVTVNNNGHVFSATMVAGSIGISARDAAASSSEAANRGDTPKKKASLRGGSMKLREEEKDKSEESNTWHKVLKHPINYLRDRHKSNKVRTKNLPSSSGVGNSHAVSSNFVTSNDAEPKLSIIQPLSGWWIYEDEAAEAQEVREAEKKRLQEKVKQLSVRSLDSAAVKEYADTSSRLKELEAH